MSSTGSGDGPDDRASGSWTTETLPLSVRRELLERELRRLGFRKAAAKGGPTGHATGPAQQDGQHSSHPQADADGGGHGD